MIDNASIILDPSKLSSSNVEMDLGKECIWLTKLPYEFDLIWKYLILYNHSAYKEFCNELVGGYIHRSFPNIKYSESSYIRDLFQKNSVFNHYEDYNKEISENYQQYHVILTPEELEMVVLSIKSSVKLLSKDDILSTIEVLSKENDKFTLTENFGVDLIKSDEEWFKQFQNLTEISFPSCLSYWIESKLRVDSDSTCVILLEYIKFLILKSRNPSEWIPSYFISRVWIEHWVLTKHFSEIWENILGVKEETMHFVQSPTDWEVFKDMYENTLELYRGAFGWEPHNQVWRDWQTEFSESNKTRLNVNLERLVNYYYFENQFIWGKCEKFYSPDKSFNELVDMFANQNPIRIYGKDIGIVNRMIENRKLRSQAKESSNLTNYLWRKNYNSMQDKEILNWVDKNCDKFTPFWIGGLKFSSNNDYNINYCCTYNDNENFIMNLDDYADNNCESIHLYQNNSKTDLNRYLIEGMKIYSNLKEK